MSIAAVLYDRLTTYAGTSALIGTRCYRMRLPDKPTLPAIVYQRVGSSEQQGSSDIREARYQFDCWATTSAAAEALSTQVRTALEDWTGGSSAIKYARVANELDDYEPDEEVYRVIMDVLFTLQE